MLKMMVKGALLEPSFAHFAKNINVENHADFFGFSMDVSSENFSESLKFLNQLITEPNLNEQILEHEKEKSWMEIQKVSKDPLRRPVELFYQSLFAGHPYAFSRYGNESTIKSVSLEQITEWHRELIQVDHMVIALTSDIPQKKAFDELFEIFGMIPTKTKSKRASVLPLIPFKKFKPSIEETTQDRTSIVLGHKGVDAKDHRYYDLEILRNWLAGSRGQLHLSLREKLSLAQTVNAYNVSLLRGGAFFLHATTVQEQEAPLTEYMETFFSSLSKLVISKESFETAKQQTIAMFSHGLRKNDALSYHMASQYMTAKHADTIDDYQHKVESVSLPKLMSTISEVFFEDSYAVGILRGIDG